MIGCWRRLAGICVGAAWFAVAIGAARAENADYSNYPARSISMVVPFAAGGPTDIVARILARGLSRAFEQDVRVETVVGAGGTIAANRVRRAEPDGYTIMVGHLGTHAAVAGYLPGVYDPVADFAAIGLAAHVPVVVVVRSDLPPKTLPELKAYARTHNLVMGQAGVGSVSFAFCTQLDRLLGLSPKTVAFNGTEPALEALIAGRVDYVCDQAPSVVAFLSSGKIRPLAISSRARSDVFPDVPTAIEAGEPGFSDSSWVGLFAPRDTPPAILAKLNAALAASLDEEDTSRELKRLGVSPALPSERSQTYFADFVRAETVRWSEIVRATPNR